MDTAIVFKNSPSHSTLQCACARAAAACARRGLQSALLFPILQKICDQSLPEGW